MESVKRYFFLEDGSYELNPKGDWVGGADFDRVQAENLALQSRLTVQDQRVDELTELLRLIDRTPLDRWYRDGLNSAVFAALNPTAEAASHE